ncbi:hypothetical protein AB6A40_009815 [Gnathostoma spinigerum]|uniref:Mon2 C-terminal domain-containing protein n=1 Tax=Gnathostoma spinigerum TaxID=75299 RepID=A0ABD6ETC8_9BILA
MEQIIDLLNRGSITKLDPNDVMALDSYQQRTDLSRLCFDALLSMSQCEESSYSSSFDRSSTVPKSISANSSVSQPSKLASTSSSANLGCSAISSLLSRCKEVLAGFTRDEQGAGNLNLPYERIVEMLSILNAVSTLIEGLVRRPNALQTGYFRELVNLYPVLVDCIPSCRCDRQVEQALTATLKSYEMIMRLKLQSQ